MAGDRADGEGHCEPGRRDLRKGAQLADFLGSLPSEAGGDGGRGGEAHGTNEYYLGNGLKLLRLWGFSPLSRCLLFQGSLLLGLGVPRGPLSPARASPVSGRGGHGEGGCVESGRAFPAHRNYCQNQVSSTQARGVWSAHVPSVPLSRSLRSRS